jgi:cytoskeletal protein RodZ
MDVGAQLRSSRESRRLTLETVARTIRVQPRVLVAIERNDAGGIPPRPFGRGFVHAYAREVGLNPDETVREYFGQFVPAQVTAPPPPVHTTPSVLHGLFSSSRVTLAAALATVVAIVGAALLVRASKELPPHDPGLVGTTGGVAPAAAPESTAASTKRSQSPAQAASHVASRPLTVVIEATAPCWVTARTDGNRALYRLLQPGERSTLAADSEVVLVAGNAAGLTWTINGRAAGVLGGPGEVRTVTITPRNAASIK